MQRWVSDTWVLREATIATVASLLLFVIGEWQAGVAVIVTAWIFFADMKFASGDNDECRNFL